MKRQNQGIYCNSPFQLFLIGLRFNYQLIDDFCLFDNLKQILTKKQQPLVKQFIKIQNDKYKYANNYQNLHFLRYTAYQITYQNYQKRLINKNTIHNILIFLFALTDIYISSICSYIQMINDPLYKIIQLMCRYSLFRSFILEIQENLGFIFEIYDTLYSESIKDSVQNKPKFSFWRPAMTKWSSKMNKIHQITNQAYFTLLNQMRKNNLNLIFDKHPLLKQSQIIICNNLSFNNEFDQLSLNDSQKNHKFSISQSHFTNFFSQNSQLYDLLTMQYIQYMVDLSIDQFTVHWCGHSQHSLQKNYIDFQGQFIKYNQFYNEYLNKSINVNNNQKLKLKLMNIFMQEELNFLQTKNIKNLTLKCILNDINQCFFNQEINQINQLVQDEYKLTPLKIDFIFKDENLKYFNQKAKIAQSLDEKDKLYFSIQPYLSPEQIIIKSIFIDDNQQKQKQIYHSDNQQNNIHNNSYVYNSESQQDQKIGITYIKSNIKITQTTSSQLINLENDEITQSESDKINENQEIIQGILIGSQMINSFLKSSNSTTDSMNQNIQQNKFQVLQQNDSLRTQQQVLTLKNKLKSQ